MPQKMRGSSRNISANRKLELTAKASLVFFLLQNEQVFPIRESGEIMVDRRFAEKPGKDKGLMRRVENTTDGRRQCSERGLVGRGA